MNDTGMPKGLGPLQEPFFVRQTLALSLLFVGAWLLTTRIFPLFDDILPITREICTAVYGIALAAVAILATLKPALLHRRGVGIAIFTSILLGALMLYGGLGVGSVALVVAGASLGRIGICLLQIVIGISLMQHKATLLALGIIIAFALSYLEQGILLVVPQGVSLVAFVAFPLIAYGLVAHHTAPVFELIRAADPPSISRITKPSSYLPFSHHLFICFFLFRVLYGYTLSFGEIGGTPLNTLISVVAIIALGLVVLVGRRALNPDIVFQVSALIIISGLLLVPVSLSAQIHSVISTILASGIVLFDVVFWFTVTSIARRNPTGAIPVFAWGNSVTAFGIILGAFLGRNINHFVQTDPVVATLITSGILLVFITYSFVLLKRFSFAETISNVVPDTAVMAPDPSSVTTRFFEDCCERLGHAYGLTPREHEVFLLLARGRSGRYIKDSLVISHNTVKAHVKNIYRKMDLHTHQELVDAIESEERAHHRCEGTPDHLV